MTAGTAGPLTRVLTALDGGATSLIRLSDSTGLSADVVEAAVEHLVRTGRVQLTTLGIGCPSRGCGSCPSAARDSVPGCGAHAMGRSRGPVLVALTVAGSDSDRADTSMAGDDALGGAVDGHRHRRRA